MSELTRRDFLASSVLTIPTFAGVVSIPAALHAAAYPGGRSTLRVGLVGCGGRGTGAAVQALRADPGAVLVAMGDVFPERLQSCHAAVTRAMGDQAAERVRVPDEHRFAGFDACRRVLDAGVDVVLLATYPAFRPAHLRDAVEVGAHVFAEKPVAVDGPGVRSALESARLAQEKRLACVVGFCWRFNEGMAATFDRVHAGALGRLLTVHTTYHTGTLGRRPREAHWSDLEFQMRNWWHFTWLSGDHIVEQAVHSIDRLMWAMSDQPPLRVNCLGGRAARSGPEHGNVFDHFAAVYEYPDGRRTFHTCRQIDRCPSDNTDYIYGEQGWCVVNGWQPTYSIRDHDGRETWSYSGPVGDMYQNELNALFESIRKGEPLNDLTRGAHSTLAAIMARQSAYTGQTVTWQQAMNSRESLVPETLDWNTPPPTPEVAVPGITRFI
jgi:predicted dehydrogenase